MTNAYNPEAWREVFLMLGGALAALAGLLFVALSIKIDVIRKEPHWRIRAFGNTFALIGLLIESALVMMPQDRLFLGVEIAVLNFLLLLFVPVRAFVRLRLDPNIPARRLVSGIAIWSLGFLGGISLLARAGGGMYLVIASCLGIIWLCVLNAWSFLTVEEPAGSPR